MKSWRGRLHTWVLFLKPFNKLHSRGAQTLCKWNQENFLVCLGYKVFTVRVGVTPGKS